MELLSRLRLRKTQSQNPEFHHLTPQTNNSEMETHDSARIHNVETKESFTEKKEEKDEDGTSEGRSTANPPFPVREMEKRAIDSPPADDCCPICFGSFAVACRASCGHWYCGGCILQYWNYGAALQPCKCPLCFRQITSLRPEASLYHLQEVGVTDVLKNVQKYNRLFVGGTHGFFLRMLEMPFFMKRVFQGLMDPEFLIESLATTTNCAFLQCFWVSFTLSAPLTSFQQGV